MSSGAGLVGLLGAAFALRLLYGLSMPFWREDERQVYLVGLHAFARGEWPYFGADVVWTGSQLPGALQGVLVAWPLEIWSAPEAPFVLLNVLSMLGLALLACYLWRRFPGVPRWLVLSALLSLPWTLDFSTHVVNVSYVLLPAIAFFVGFFEATPAFRCGLVPVPAAWALMGAGLLALVQIHLSWVLLLPYMGWAVITLVRHQGRARLAAGAAWVCGAALSGGLLLPTLLAFGPSASGVDSALAFNPQAPDVLLGTLARLLSFVSLEFNRFLGLDTPSRLLFVWRHPWVVPAVVIVLVAGVAQPVLLAVAWFGRRRHSDLWHRTRWLLGLSVLWIYASFFLSIRGPQAHSFYVLFPVAAMYAAGAWQVWVVPSARAVTYERVAAVALLSGLLVHVGLALDRLPRQSLYRDRSLVAAAVGRPNDRLLGDRRDSLQRRVDRRPRPIDGVPAATYLAAEAGSDLVLLSTTWSPAIGGRVSRFATSIRHTGSVAAWLDIRLEATYRDAAGVVVARRDLVLKEILEPGVERSWPDLTDGWTPPGAVSATLRVVGAERVIPLIRPFPG